MDCIKASTKSKEDSTEPTRNSHRDMFFSKVFIALAAAVLIVAAPAAKRQDDGPTCHYVLQPDADVEGLNLVREINFGNNLFTLYS